MSEVYAENNKFVGYEYKETVIDSSSLSAYLDGYENFGWVLDENQPDIQRTGKIVLKLKRDRKIMNKTELTRLQKHFEDCMKQIETLENSKTSLATVIALIIGVVGTAFMAGSVFAVTHEPPLVVWCIILAIPGFIGWIMPYFMYEKVKQKKTEKVNPIIDIKQDEIYEICEKGHKLLV